MSDDPTTRRRGGRHDGPARTSPYPTSRLAPVHDLVDTAREIQQADALLGAVAGDKLRAIAEQIRALQEQARVVMDNARRDAQLHRARCAFPKRPGQVYHLYRRADGQLYFSLLSPAEWNGAPPDPFEGSYRLELDQSWSPAGNAPAPRLDVARLLASGADEERSEPEGAPE